MNSVVVLQYEVCCYVRQQLTGALLTVVAMADAGSDPGLLPPAIADVVVLPVTTLVATNSGEVAFSGKDFGSRSTGLDWPTLDCARICTICFKSEFRSDMMNACTGGDWPVLPNVIGQVESSCFNIARFWTTNLKFTVFSARRAAKFFLLDHAHFW